MPLLYAGDFIDVLKDYRFCWILGKTGGHKTSIAYRISRELMESNGYRLVSNNRCVWADELRDLDFVNESGHLRLILVLDEGGLKLSGAREFKLMAAYPAKMDVVYLIPSLWPPPRAAQVLTLQPMFQHFFKVGVPLILYKWRVRLGSFTTGGWFAWWKPSEIYGVYSRQDPGSSIYKIVRFMERKTQDYIKLYDREDEEEEEDNEQVSGVEAGGGFDFSGFEEAAEVLADSADRLESRLETVSFRKGRK